MKQVVFLLASFSLSAFAFDTNQVRSCHKDHYNLTVVVAGNNVLKADLQDSIGCKKMDLEVASVGYAGGNAVTVQNATDPSANGLYFCDCN